MGSQLTARNFDKESVRLEAELARNEKLRLTIGPEAQAAHKYLWDEVEELWAQKDVADKNFEHMVQHLRSSTVSSSARDSMISYPLS